MPEYVWLRKGDQLPAVAAAQALLNRTGASLKVDGHFGSNTKKAVQAFQRERKLADDGVIGEKTWPRLKGPDRMQIIDCVDVFDFAMLKQEVEPLQNMGGRPIVIGGMSNGIEQAVMEVRKRATPGSLYLLRFHGHGAPGLAGASSGELAFDPDSRSDWANTPETRAALMKLKGLFGAFGCIQFMHCQTGRRKQGKEFLSLVANAAGVPASGAYRDQYSSTAKELLRYEGPARSVCPAGRSLKEWSMGRPQLVGMSVM